MKHTQNKSSAWGRGKEAGREGNRAMRTQLQSETV